MYLMVTCTHQRLPTISALHGFIKGAGFQLGPTVNVTEALFQEDHWLDKEGPFREEWRNTDRYVIGVFNCVYILVQYV